MRKAIRIGRLFGIELRVDSSWLIIFVLIAWSLTALFMRWHPDWSVAISIVVAVVSSLLFFASVLFHELAHSLVARLYRIPVRDITLHLFGGVSNIEREPPTPGAEFLIAIVGPISSVVLGVILLGLASLSAGVSGVYSESAEQALLQIGPGSTLLLWLGPINILVGVFNLIPGFPLDGGRVLRSILWKATGDLRSATRWAAGVGQLVGWGFIITGVFMAFGYPVPFFGSGLVGGIWLGLIGLFLRNAAAAQVVGSQLEAALAGVRVFDLMRRAGAWVSADLDLRSLVSDWFMRHDERAFPVFDGSTFVGLVSLDDVRKVPSVEWDARSVRDVMTPRESVSVVAPEEEAAEALRKLGAAPFRQLPVMTGEALVGMLYEQDVARWLELQAPASRRPKGQPRPRHA